MNERRQRLHLGRPAPRLPAAARWTLRGLVTLPLVALIISSGLYFASVYHLLRAHLVPIAEAELTRQTGHEVRIGGADFSRRGALVLTNIAISNKATFAAGHGEATLAARRVTVDYNLHSLIFDSGNAAHALGDITLEQPVLLVERYPNRFNFSDFFKPKTTKANKPFVGRILVHHGLLKFRDFNAPQRGLRPAVNTLAAVEGTIDFFSERNVYFDVQGQGTGTRFASLIVNGDVSRQFAGRYRGHVVTTNADAAYWTDYFKAFPQARIGAGRADVDVTLAKLGSKPPPGLPLDLSGHVAIRNARVLVADRKLLRLPLENLSGTAAFTGAGLSLDAHASVGGQRLAVSGTVFDFAAPQVAVTASSPRLDPVRLADAVPVLKPAIPKGLSVSPGPVTANFTGTPGSPTITVGATLPAVVYLGNQATNLRAQAIYANKVLSIPTATFRLNGTGQAALRGTVDTSGAKPVILLAGVARGVNLADLRLPPALQGKTLKLGGLVDAQFLADNQGRPLTVTANVSAGGLHVRQTTLRSVMGRVAWTQGQALTLTRVVARDPSGAAAVSGTVPIGSASGRWNLNVRTAGLDIAGLLAPYSRIALSGRAAFDGKVIGPANAPQAVGAVRMIEPRFGRYAADLVTGQVTASLSSVRLQDVTLRRFPTEAAVNGLMTQLSGANPLLALHVKLSEGDVADFLHLAEEASVPSPKTAHALTAGLPNLTGTASGFFTISGRLKSPAVAGHALVTDATVGDYRLDQVAADLRYDHDTLHVENGRVQSEGATLTANGERTASGAVSASFTASGVDLVRFHQFLDPYADVTGTAALVGSFSGTPSAPHVVVKALDVPDLIVNRQKFAPFTLAGRYDDGVVTQTGAPWRFVVSVPADYAAEAGGQVEYDINALHLTLPTALHPKRTTEMALKAAIPATAPERLSHIFATIRGSQFARTPAGIDLMKRLADLPQPLSATFALPSVTVEGPTNALNAQAELSATNLTLGEMTIAGLTAGLSYTAGAKPSGSVKAKASNLLAAGLPIGAVSADIDYHNRIIAVHQLQATSERAFLSASGTANLDGDIAASLDASNIPLAPLKTILPSLVAYFRPADPELKAARQSTLNTALAALPREISVLSVRAYGPTFSPSAAGSVFSPNLVGSISLSNPEASSAGPASPGVAAAAYALDRIRSGTITLASAAPGMPKVLTVNDLSAFKNGRLAATLSGSLPLINAGDQAAAALLPDQDLHAVLKVQDLAALAGFSHDPSDPKKPGLLDPKKTGGQLSVTANFGSGQLSGLATMTNASVGLTNFDTFVNKINGIIVLADNKATIQSLTGQSSKTGSFALTGNASLGGNDPSLDLKLTAKNLIVDENSKQNALAQNFNSALKATINGALTIAGPWMAPAIATPPNAPVVISDANGTLPSPSDTTAGAGAAPAFDPSFDVALQLGGGRSKTVKIRGGLLQAEATGKVRLQGRLSAPEFHGSLQVARGQFILPPSTLLKIVKPRENDSLSLGGNKDNFVTLDYPRADANGVPGLQTNVNIWAQTTVSPSSATLAQYRSVAGNGIGEAVPEESAAFSNSLLTGGRQRYTITVHIYGLLGSTDPEKLHDEFYSSPGGLTKAQMVAALVPASALTAAAGGGAGGQSILEDQFKTALANVAIPTLLTPITESIASSLGLEDVNVTYDPSLAQGLASVTAQLGPRVDVTFTRSFGSRGVTDQTLLPPQYTLQLGYDITNRYRLGVATDDQHNNTVTLEGVIRF